MEENALFLTVGEQILASLVQEEETPPIPRPVHTSRRTGHVWVHEMLYGHESRCYENLRVHPSMFVKLRDILVERDLIRDCRYVTASEQLAMFLNVIGHGVKTGPMKENFQHSSETVSHYVNLVIRALASLRSEYLKLPNGAEPVHPRVRHDDRFYPYFKVNLFG